MYEHVVQAIIVRMSEKALTSPTTPFAHTVRAYALQWKREQAGDSERVWTEKWQSYRENETDTSNDSKNISNGCVGLVYRKCLAASKHKLILHSLIFLCTATVCRLQNRQTDVPTKVVRDWSWNGIEHEQEGNEKPSTHTHSRRAKSKKTAKYRSERTNEPANAMEMEIEREPAADSVCGWSELSHSKHRETAFDVSVCVCVHRQTPEIYIDWNIEKRAPRSNNSSPVCEWVSECVHFNLESAARLFL